MKKLSEPTRAAVTGALNRSARNRRPRHAEIDWHRTIRANLKHYQPDYQTVVPEVRIGYGRRRQSMRHIILCIDQSGSMATSVVYSAIFGAVMATLPAVSTSLVVFDTAVVDLTDELDDPVDLLFWAQLGGGTDINGAVALLPVAGARSARHGPRADHRSVRRRRGDGVHATRREAGRLAACSSSRCWR